MKVIGDVNDMVALENDIRSCILQMNQAIKTIRTELARVGMRWNDTGYHQINQTILSVMEAVTRHVEDIGDFLAALKEYEQVLRGGDTPARGGGTASCAEAGLLSRTGFSVGYESTREVWNQTGDGMVYDSPLEKRAVLDLCQGKVPGFRGTCGLCSCVNVLRLAGVDATEEQIVEYASENGQCTYRRLGSPERNGATSADNREEILRHFGLETKQVPSSVESIAQAVSEGRGVIVSVHARRLWGGLLIGSDFHAVTVTSVKKDMEGNILGFYIADSGIHGKDGDGYYSREVFEKALTKRDLNVTERIIR